MNVYLLIHAINEAYKSYTYYEVEICYSNKEDALADLEKKVKSIENGTSTNFPGESIKGEENNVPFALKYYTFEWTNEGGEKMFTHYYVMEMKLK